MSDYIETMAAMAIDGDSQAIFFWEAVYTLVLLTYSFVYQLRVNAWPGITGDLVELGVKKFGATSQTSSDQEYVGNARYTYQVGGREYLGRRISAWGLVASHNMKFILDHQLGAIQQQPASLPAGSAGKVQVFYNPRNPGKSYLVKPGVKSQFITLLLGYLPLFLYWYRYHA